MDQLAVASSSIASRVVAMPEVQAGPVLVYVAFRREIRTRPLIEALLQRGVEVAVPFIDGAEMQARRLERLEDLVPGAMGIDTSSGEEIAVSTCITPGLAFSMEGARLGFGAGYYDRFFARHPDIYAIGLCLDAQVRSVPVEAHDRPMDALVTPSRTVRIPVQCSASEDP